MKRSRGRSQNNNMNRRGGQNNLSRTYESSGPDIKVRGTAPQVAEKYTQLWRDALSSGDMVAAENYLQHAEHYNRIVASFQPVQAPPSYNHNEDETGEDADASADAEGAVEGEGRDNSRHERHDAPYNRSSHNQDYAPREHRRDNRNDNRGDGRGHREHNPRFNRDRDREPRQNYDQQPREVRPARAFDDQPVVESSTVREPRQAEQRQNEPRQNQGGQDSRQRFPRENGDNRTPRPRLPRGRYNNQNDDADVGELPSFITGGSSSAGVAPQNVAPVQNTGVVTPVTPLSVIPDHGPDEGVDAAEATAAPRRRYRTRTTAPEAVEGEIPAPVEKRAPRRRAAPVRKENVEAE